MFHEKLKKKSLFAQKIYAKNVFPLIKSPKFGSNQKLDFKIF